MRKNARNLKSNFDFFHALPNWNYKFPSKHMSLNDGKCGISQLATVSLVKMKCFSRIMARIRWKCDEKRSQKKKRRMKKRTQNDLMINCWRFIVERFSCVCFLFLAFPNPTFSPLSSWGRGRLTASVILVCYRKRERKKQEKRRRFVGGRKMDEKRKKNT